ncbi:MAG: hypothetical protein U1E29_01060 [Coriobacteriia bacterium]|jgi:hypothetical protein|nr:hypothetical protein [Coriobacteriia bacterium]
MRIRVALASVAVLVAVPAQAHAATAGVEPNSWAGYVIGILSLLAAAFLLVDAVLLRRVAHGGAIAENISFMVLGVVCLAASVLLKWVVGFLPADVSLPQAELASDGLVLLSMVLLALYFWRVRSALASYLKAAQAYAASVPTPASESAVVGESAPEEDGGRG